MTEVKMEGEVEEQSSVSQDPQCEGGKCASTEAQLIDKQEEMSLAVLLAMVPLLVFTLFGQVGLL